MTQRYYGSKIVTAWKAENKGQPGYGVKYGGGYTSWSPKDTFEASYLPMGNSDSLPGWQERIVAEMVQLEDRIKKIEAYLGSPALEGLTEVAIDLLRDQLDVMSRYDAILRLRAGIHGVFKDWKGPEA